MLGTNVSDADTCNDLENLEANCSESGRWRRLASAAFQPGQQGLRAGHFCHTYPLTHRQ
jgi:hypothetical protein